MNKDATQATLVGLNEALRSLKEARKKLTSALRTTNDLPSWKALCDAEVCLVEAKGMLKSTRQTVKGSLKKPKRHPISGRDDFDPSPL